jgi:uncharacterized membrane protein YjjB (DUF3815 family)
MSFDMFAEVVTTLLFYSLFFLMEAFTDHKKTIAGGAVGGGTGALIGTILAPGIGTVIGAAIGSALGGCAGEHEDRRCPHCKTVYPSLEELAQHNCPIKK